jgi:hypothetical protein
LSLFLWPSSVLFNLMSVVICPGNPSQTLRPRLCPWKMSGLPEPEFQAHWGNHSAQP